MSDLQWSRRRTRIVDAAAQRRIVRSITTVPLAVLVVASAALWFLTDSLFDEAQAAEVELPSLALLSMTMFVFVITAGIGIVLRAMDYSHRVVGPAYRITMSLRKVRAGDLEPIRLRNGDELTTVVDELNLLIADLAARRDGTAVASATAAAPTSASSPAVAPPEHAMTPTSARNGDGDGC